MQFLRVYLEADGAMKRGAITQGNLIPDPVSAVWFNPVNGMVIHDQHGKISCFSYDRIPGNESFRVYFFNDHQEIKSFDEITNKTKEVKNDRKTRTKL